MRRKGRKLFWVTEQEERGKREMYWKGREGKGRENTTTNDRKGKEGGCVRLMKAMNGRRGGEGRVREGVKKESE